MFSFHTGAYVMVLPVFTVIWKQMNINDDGDL